MTNRKISILFLTLILAFISPQLNAQISLGGLKNKVKATQKSPEERLAAKMEKSPAKAEIQVIEAAMKKLNSLDSRNRNDSYLSKNKEQLAEFETPYFSLRDTLPLLKSKDPKWKTATYDAMLSKSEKRHPKIKKEYEVNKRSNDLLDFIKSKKRMKPKFRFGYNYSCASLDTDWKQILCC